MPPYSLCPVWRRLFFRQACLLVCGLTAAAATAVQEQSLSADHTAAARPGPVADARLVLERGDVVAFVGGADVESARQEGHLEALLAARYREFELRFRNFGWEGDTVHARPRDVNFPSLREHLRRAGATAIVLQFGRTEALGGRDGLAGFVTDYERLLDECAQQTPRLVLVTPPPLEKGGGLLPDLSLRNVDLAEYADAIRRLAHRRNLVLVDVFADLGGANHHEPRLTADGLQLSARGQALVARAFARRLGFSKVADAAGEPDEKGVWPNVGYERLRRVIVAKNRLWFQYWRPQNWAFLGGDRTEQPSSRDHRDAKLRWFPTEMEKFVPLIEAKEREIAGLAAKLP
ncbi:MAG: hypothetical protein E6L09_05130 [Verrucomicrobia bacterium]|nr:MAG: hypothetical protein E6L09_05130 [Verrucomicrobiota bacterium]